MAQFLVEYRDVGTPEAREAHRAEHIAYRKGLGEAILVAGPILDDDGKSAGSLVILEAADSSKAAELASGDPYLGVGVLELVSVRGFRVAVMRPSAA